MLTRELSFKLGLVVHAIHYVSVAMKTLLGTMITGKSYGVSYGKCFVSDQFEGVFIHPASNARDSSEVSPKLGPRS